MVLGLGTINPLMAMILATALYVQSRTSKDRYIAKQLASNAKSILKPGGRQYKTWNDWLKGDKSTFELMFHQVYKPKSKLKVDIPEFDFNAIEDELREQERLLERLLENTK